MASASNPPRMPRIPVDAPDSGAATTTANNNNNSPNKRATRFLRLLVLVLGALLLKLSTMAELSSNVEKSSVETKSLSSSPAVSPDHSMDLSEHPEHLQSNRNDNNNSGKVPNRNNNSNKAIRHSNDANVSEHSKRSSEPPRQQTSFQSSSLRKEAVAENATRPQAKETDDFLNTTLPPLQSASSLRKETVADNATRPRAKETDDSLNTTLPPLQSALSLRKETVAKNATRPRAKETDDFLNTTWPPLQSALCGEGAPNMELANMIFKLARSEVFSMEGAAGNTSAAFRLTRLLPKPVKKKRDSITLKSFFEGDFGLSVFHGLNDKGQPFTTVYVQIWKCANTQIRQMEDKLYSRLNGTFRRYIDIPEAIQQYLPAVYRKHSESNLPPMPPPCFYTAVRDPVSHFLSGYNEVEVRQMHSKNPDVFGNESAPYHLDFPYSKDSPELLKTRFKAFVEDLLLEEPVFGNHGVYLHFAAMSRVLGSLKRYKAELNGYIPSLSNITSIWPNFMSSTCPNFPALDTIPKMTLGGQHESSKDELGFYEASKEVWAEGGPISRSICLLHAFDYACFPELANDIPLLCKFVYGDHAEEIVRFGTKHKLD